MKGRAASSSARPLLRPSLRVNAVLIVLAMLVLPQAIVAAWSLMERDINGKLQWSARQVVLETAVVLEGAASLDDSTLLRALDEIASRQNARLRLVESDGHERLDVDHDRGTDLVHQIGTLFFGPDGAPTLREVDESFGPVPSRPEVAKVTEWLTPPPPPPPPPEGTPRLAASSAPAPASTIFASSLPPPPPSNQIETGCRTSPAEKLLVCHAARRVDIGGQRYVVYAQESSRRAVRALYDLRYHLLRLTAVMLPLALAFSWWMGRRMVRPIESLRARVLEKARSANPRADLAAARVDEVGDLADAFNDLLVALADRRRANEAFVADLVHEFKNPVAAIRASAEALASGGVDDRRAERLSRILADSSGRLDALVSQFLELARAEAGLPNESRGPIDVAALARGVVASVEAAYPGVRFAVDAAGSEMVVGVEGRLDTLVRNLVDNAASFASDGGEVRVVVRREAAGFPRVVIEVSDTGPGIAEDDLPRVFDRFFTTRGQGAASDRRGTGLGLALVKAVAEAHGGEVSARSMRGAGATFLVVLPVTLP